MFKFTFSGNGVSNPFAAKAEEELIQKSVAPQPITRKLPVPPKRPLPPPSVLDRAPPSRKRGWAPSTSSASAATSQPAFTNGWIDTPSRYLEAALQSHRGDDEDEGDMNADLPPAKRRKTLTDTIISTAFSAALIGTAVGMTAYRMWRDRGKPTGEDRSISMEPPPPYAREEWVDDVSKNKPARRPPKKPRSVRRHTTRRRMAPIAISPPSRSPMHFPSPSKFAFQPEESQEDEDGLEQQIDWMGDKIRSLIEEGQRALGKEVVVMNDDEGDEEGAVDDGMDGWEEEDNHAAGPSSLTSAGYRQPRRRLYQGLEISVSPPSHSAFTLPASYSRSPTSPQVKRSRTITNGKCSQGSSTSTTSPRVNTPSPRRLGAKGFDRKEDFKVIYEPAPAFPNSDIQSDGHFQDEDSRGLAERMENIRKAYRIH